MPSFAIYLIGFLVLSAGVLFGASLLGVPTQWVGVIGLVLVGFGVMVGVVKTRRQDAPAASDPPAE